jgi:hypothetical protein
MTDTQEVTLTSQCIDVCGCPFTPPPSTPSWANSDNTVATITPSDDGTTCLVTAVAMGFTDVTVTVGEMSTTTRVVVDPPVLNYVTVVAGTPVAQ